MPLIVAGEAVPLVAAFLHPTEICQSEVLSLPTVIAVAGIASSTKRPSAKKDAYKDAGDGTCDHKCGALDPVMDPAYKMENVWREYLDGGNPLEIAEGAGRRGRRSRRSTSSDAGERLADEDRQHESYGQGGRRGEQP